jgi:hypothetical protein
MAVNLLHNYYGDDNYSCGVQLHAVSSSIFLHFVTGWGSGFSFIGSHNVEQ